MKTTADFLDDLRLKLDLPSDGRLADYLGMHRQHISKYRTLGATFDDEKSIKIAEILNLEPAFVVSCMHYQRAKKAPERAMWERLAKIALASAAALAITSTSAGAGGLQSPISDSVYYVKSLRHQLRRLFLFHPPRFA